MNPYKNEILDNDEDDGTMPDSLSRLSDAVVGRRIVAVSKVGYQDWLRGPGIVLYLDNGTKAFVRNTSDCCAYTEIESFLLSPNSVDHVITGVGTTDGFTTWHIYADMGDVLKLNVEWSCGNPFYYGYGFRIEVEEI